MARIKGATYDGPPKGYSTSGAKKMYVAWHNTSNDASPAAEASYAKRRTDKVSSHFYCDPKTVIQSLDTAHDAWHAGSSTGNRKAVALELTGGNSWSEAYWRSVIDRVAPVVAEVCRIHGITPRFLSVAEAKAGKLTGFVTHDDMRRAWGGTSHTDPGPNFPKAYAVAAVKRHMDIPTAPVVNPPKPPTPPVTDWTVKLIMALPMVERNSKGQIVKNVQGLLNAHGYSLKIDGDFGPATDSAVRSFQKSRKLVVDGEVGQKTYTALITK